MCGRFTLHHSTEDIAERFAIEQPTLKLTPRYNIAPTQPVAVHRESRTLEEFTWGLVPGWAKDPAIGNRIINARAESASEKPAFREALRRRRCLVPASGYYEWRRSGPQRLPMYLRLGDGRPMALAGLWEEWTAPSGAILQSGAILTTAPNPLAATVHTRMPAILDDKAIAVWLDPAVSDTGQLTSLLEPYAGDNMIAHPVSTAVNRVDYDEAECIEPVEPLPPPDQLRLGL